MPRLENIKKVMIIGSGPIVIGAAKEGGEAAVKSLQEYHADIK